MVPSNLVLMNLEPCTKIRTLGAQLASLSGSKQQKAGNEASAQQITAKNNFLSKFDKMNAFFITNAVVFNMVL